jgi:hypothetical protein
MQKKISVVICSKTPSLLSKLTENIEQTIGCNYELIVVSNLDNKFSIFEAYNYGLDESISDIICFIHEDILFHSNNWGVYVNSVFRDTHEIGLLGVAGSRVKSDIPSGWWECDKAHQVVNIIQHRQDGSVELLEFGFNKNSEQEVAVIDGVFMCFNKNSQIRFNENLKGFHNYDLSISLDFSKKGYKVLVTNQILLEHFSNGTIDSKWVNSAVKFNKLYIKDLPKVKGVGKFSSNDKTLQLANFINHCKNTGNAKLAFIYWVKLLSIAPLNLNHIQHLQYFIKFFRSKLIRE